MTRQVAAGFSLRKNPEVLPEALASHLAKMAGFRNLLIHKYWEIEDKKVYQYIKTEIGNIQQYLKIVRDKYLRAS